MDPIKEAFFKIKEEINNIKLDVDKLKQNQVSTEFLLQKISEISEKINIIYNKSKQSNNPTDNPTTQQTTSVEQQVNSTNQQTDNSDFLKNNGLNGLKYQNFNFSTGSDGVPTNKPTNQQTNQHSTGSDGVPTDNPTNKHFMDINSINNDILLENNAFSRASIIINSLDDIKREIRKTFKNLTNQEMVVFSTLYELDEKQTEDITYKDIANILNLSESSIRDYTNKLINKGILIEKHRINNKKIVLGISKKLKEITNLSTIVKLRDL